MGTIDERKQALANLLEIDLCDIRRETGCVYAVADLNVKYLVLTEDEAKEDLEEHLSEYLFGHVLVGATEYMRNYFDWDEWESDINWDSAYRYGHYFYQIDYT